MKHRGVIVTTLVTWSSNCGHVTYVKVCAIWYHLYNLKSVKNTLLKVKLLQGCFSRFLSCTNGTKSGKALHIFPRIILRTGYQKMHILIQNWNFFTLTSNALLERLKQTPEKKEVATTYQRSHEIISKYQFWIWRKSRPLKETILEI